MVNQIIDLHTDYVLACYEKGIQFKSSKQINPNLLRKSSVRLIMAGFSYDNLLNDSELQLTILHEQINKHVFFCLIKDKTDLKRVFSSQNKIGVIIHLEGAAMLNNDIKKLQWLYEKGVRSVGLTHSIKNSLASGNKENPNERLTDFGKRVVREVIKKGMMLDLAHLNEAGFYDVLNITQGPVIVSHTCAYSLCNDPRNIRDDQIKAVSKRKGIIGIFFSSKFVKKNKQKITLDDVVAHFVHIAKVGGIQTVAIGSDFGGITTGLPKNLESVSKFKHLFIKLKNAGFSSNDISRISYQNAKRVLLQVLQ